MSTYLPEAVSMIRAAIGTARLEVMIDELDEGCRTLLTMCGKSSADDLHQIKGLAHRAAGIAAVLGALRLHGVLCAIEAQADAACLQDARDLCATLQVVLHATAQRLRVEAARGPSA